MAHPFFDVVVYPWSRPEAGEFHRLLAEAVRTPSDIDYLYRSCGDGPTPLQLNNPPRAIWKDALDNLSSAGLLRALCDILRGNARYRAEAIQNAVGAVVDATGGPPARRKRPRETPDRPKPKLFPTDQWINLPRTVAPRADVRRGLTAWARSRGVPIRILRGLTGAGKSIVAWL